MRVTPRSGWILAAALLLGAGCSDSSTGPNGPNVPDVAALLAEMSPASLSAVASLASPLGAPTVGQPGVPDPTKCPYSATSGFFECSAVTINGLTFTEKFRLIDDAGHSQPLPSTQTSAVETVSTITGTVSTTSGGQVVSNYHVDGSSDQTLSGVRTSQHTLNGTSSTRVTGQVLIGTQSVPLDELVTQTTTALVLPNTKAGQKWPASGTITTQVTTNPDNTLLRAKLTIEMTFNGSSTVAVKITDPLGTSRSCNVNLETQAGLQACLA